MTAERRMARVLSEKWADERAHRIATDAAESLVQSEGTPTDRPGEFVIQAAPDDEHLRECIAHLEWHGLAVSKDTRYGSVMVLLEPQNA